MLNRTSWKRSGPLPRESSASEAASITDGGQSPASSSSALHSLTNRSSVAAGVAACAPISQKPAPHSSRGMLSQPMAVAGDRSGATVRAGWSACAER